MKRALKIFGVGLLVLPLAFIGYIWWKLQPWEQNLPLPIDLVAIDSAEGQALLASADYRADYSALAGAFQSQELISYCGVASGVMVLNALGGNTSQGDFFTPEASRVRSRMQVTLGGMSLLDLDSLLAAHGVETIIAHGDAATLDEFRSVIKSNLARPKDFLLANYQRETLRQGRVGHISPLAAYHSASDRVLIMDTASYKYPHTWVPVEVLYAAMQEIDNASGQTRGFIEASLPATKIE